jgi:YVTN family beta-propeller protein
MYDTDETDAETRKERRTGQRSLASEPIDKTGTGSTRRTFLQASSIALGALAVPGVASASSTGECDVLFTSNRKDGTLTLNDAHTYEHLGTVNVLPDGDEPDDLLQEIAYPFVNLLAGGKNFVQDLDLSPDGRTVYVSRGHLGDVAAIDLETNDLLWETEIAGFRADHQTISKDGRFLYTSGVTADAVHKIETEQGTKVDTVEVTTYPHGNLLHELPGLGDGVTLINGSLGNMLYPDATFGDYRDHRLTFINPNILEVLQTFDFEEGVRPFVFSPDGRTAYVQISYFHGFHEYDVVDDRIARTRHLPKTAHVPEDESDYPLQSAHHGIDISSDSKYLCIAGTTSWYAAVVRRSDLKLMNTIPVGKYPYWIETAPDGEHAFVAVKSADTVSVINYADAAEVARIPVGDAPMVMEHQSIPESVL